MYEPKNIKELMPDEDWPIGVIEFVDDEVNDGMMYIAFGREDIWKDSLDNIQCIRFPIHAIVVVREHAIPIR